MSGRTTPRGLLLSLLVVPFVSGLSEDPLLVSGAFAGETPPVPPSVRVVSYNIHGPAPKRFEPILQVLARNERIRGAAVFALQEVSRNGRASGGRDAARDLARKLALNFVYAAEKQGENGAAERGLSILSPYPISQPVRLLLQPGSRQRIALGATLQLGGSELRVYTLHLDPWISGEKRRGQVSALLEHAKQYSHLPTVILGDFNTFLAGDRKIMFQVMQGDGFTCPLKGDKSTFRARLVLRLKLDWIWLRNLEHLEADVEGSVKASDHRPVWVTLPGRQFQEAGTTDR